MSKKKTPGSHYPVGYCKPPTHSQFQKGQSGNPRGRKTGAKNKATDGKLYKLIMEESKRIVTIQDQHGQQTMPMLQVVLRSLFAVAAKGDLKAQKVALEWIRKAEEIVQKEPENIQWRTKIIIDDVCGCNPSKDELADKLRSIDPKRPSDLN